jgi:putative transposase
MPPLPRLSSAAAEYQASRQAPIAGSGEGATRDPGTTQRDWSADFMADALWSGRRFRTFNVLEDFNREALRIEIDTNLPARRVVRALDELIELRGKPAVLRVDNGPEFIGDELEKWARRHGIERRFIQPGRPMQNGFVERFNRTYRQEVLDCYVFETLGEVREMPADWIKRYNEPHARIPRQPLAPTVSDGKIPLTLYF